MSYVFEGLFVWCKLLCKHVLGVEPFQVSIRWKDVTALTKEKTALVIPNAILVCTDSDKVFFTSFGARDKAYLMLFRVWQNALMGQVSSHYAVTLRGRNAELPQLNCLAGTAK